MDELAIHPYANLLPMMTQTEYEALKLSVQADGLLQAIVLFEGKILDGRNRYRACIETGTPVRTVDYDGGDPVGFALATNSHRRTLTLKQRAIAGVQAADIYRRQAREAQRQAGRMHGRGKSLVSEDTKLSDQPQQGETGTASGADIAAGRTRKRLAEQVGVSEVTMQRALEVADGDKELWKRVCDPDNEKTITITGAWRELRGVPADGRSDAKIDYVIVEPWLEQKPKTTKLSDWQKAFYRQREKAEKLQQQLSLTRSRASHMKFKEQEEIKGLAKAEYNRIVHQERTKWACVLAFSEGHLTMRQAAQRAGMSLSQFQVAVTDLRRFLDLPKGTELPSGETEDGSQ